MSWEYSDWARRKIEEFKKTNNNQNIIDISEVVSKRGLKYLVITTDKNVSWSFRYPGQSY